MGDGNVRIRPPLLDRLTSAATPVVIGAISLAGSSNWLSIWVPLYLVLALAGYLLGSWFGVTLSPTEAIVHSLGRRRIRWTDIVAITQESELGIRKVALWTSAAERIALRAPITPFPGIGRRKFEMEFHVIGQWWLAHRALMPEP